MKTKEELKTIYNSLNDSEKHGVQFGLFPAKLLDFKLDNIDYANLMRFRYETIYEVRGVSKTIREFARRLYNKIKEVK